MFIDPAPYNRQFDATDLETNEVLRYPAGHAKAGKPLFKRRFIPARLTDNPYLSESGDYEAMLLSLPEQQRRQLLEGDWDIKEGAAFTEFNRDIHVVEPFHIPNNWVKFRACDYGYGSFSGVLWFAVAPDEQLVVYRELYVSKVLATDLADMILELEAEDGNLKYGVLDSSLWHKRGDTGPSLAEQMISKGCRWRPSDRSRGSRVGVSRLMSLLRNLDLYFLIAAQMSSVSYRPCRLTRKIQKTLTQSLKTICTTPSGMGLCLDPGSLFSTTTRWADRPAECK
jgi:hypothetical protein